MTRSTGPFEPDTAIHPGETLKEIAQYSGCKRIAVDSGIDANALILICDGVKPITPEIAVGLAKAGFGIASFWLCLQKQYDETVERLAKQEPPADD